MDNEKRIGLDKNFITVLTKAGEPLSDGFGGNQSWLNIQISDSSCGVIAAVNVYLYLIGQRRITKPDYIKLCNRYCREHPVDMFLIRIGFGALPSTMGRTIKKWCKKSDFLIKKTRWNWKKGSDQYEVMKWMVERDIPVLWGLHSQQAKKDDENKLHFYEYKNGEFIASVCTVDSHYVVVTAIYEKRYTSGAVRRMVEISSWGKRYYVDYDEYLLFADAEGLLIKLINRIGSNIVEIL